MKYITHIFLYLLIVLFESSCTESGERNFVLSSKDGVASLFILPGEPDYVHLAAQDLISDVEKITGQRIPLVTEINENSGNYLIIGSFKLLKSNDQIMKIIGNDFDKIEGKWEAYRVKNYNNDKNYLVIGGSDYRGIMFGIYDFIDQYLGVDPLYFWTDYEPVKQTELSWPEIDIYQDEPIFKYRGWFINDEDLLTEWMDGAGPRFIDYPYYSQVVNPEIMERAVEALLRLRYNLIIPASFIDISNPPEKQLVDIASARGVFLSMHHIEPMGVHGFTFRNYWKEKGKDYKFSFFSNPEAMKTIWQDYAEKWVNYPNVIWQIGLRGTADRPMWTEDPEIPESEEFRGKLISDAMQVQIEIIESVDKRDEIPVTTTLWMEGSNLNREGHLTFPENVMVIFSDNSPGWVMQPDFFETERESDRKYGIYYHHQLWGTGPHLVQGVSPLKNHEIFTLAIEYNSHEYAVLNVSNIREFPLGLQASAKMLYNFEEFDPDSFLREWCEERFGDAAHDAEAAYRQFFSSYQEFGEREIVFLLDGQMRRHGLTLLRKLRASLDENEKIDVNENYHFEDSRVGKIPFTEFAEKVSVQKESLEKAGEMAEHVRMQLTGHNLDFFEVNLIAQQKILLGITTWLEALLMAGKAETNGESKTVIYWMEKAVDAFELIKEGKELGSQGAKWEHWYRGDTKMNLPGVEKTTKEILGRAKS
jgi:hypothetical protein